LLEIGLALVIILIGAGIALNAFLENNAIAKAKAAQDQVLQVTSAVRSAYSGPVYATVSNTDLSNKGKVPANMRGATAAEIVNNYGGAVTILPASFGTGTNNGFTVSTALIPRS